MKKILKNTLLLVILTNLGLTHSLEASWQTALKQPIRFGVSTIGSWLTPQRNQTASEGFIPETSMTPITEIPSQNDSLLSSSVKQTALIGAIGLGAACLAYWLYNKLKSGNSSMLVDSSHFSDDQKDTPLLSLKKLQFKIKKIKKSKKIKVHLPVKHFVNLKKFQNQEYVPLDEKQDNPLLPLSQSEATSGIHAESTYNEGDNPLLTLSQTEEELELESSTESMEDVSESESQEERFLEMEDCSDDESHQIETDIEEKLELESESSIESMEDVSESEEEFDIQKTNDSTNLYQKKRYNYSETSLHSFLKKKTKLADIKSLFLAYAKEDKKLINLKDEQGNTPLHLLVMRKQIKFDPDYIVTLRCFLQNGADQTIRNNSGKTALDIAANNYDCKSINLLSSSKNLKPK